MMTNLRHLRFFLAVYEAGSITRAAEQCHITQPAVTQAVKKLETQTGHVLLVRNCKAIFPTKAGEVLASRIKRVFAMLDPALSDVAPRLKVSVTYAQLRALIALREAENSALAARRIGLAQPTVHRAITILEGEAGRSLFDRAPFGMIANRPAQALAQAARLAFAELEQAEADLAEISGREAGRIVVGAMPLAQNNLLAQTIQQFRINRPRIPVRVLDGSYEDLLAGLRRGETDFLVGALRSPLPMDDLEQVMLFSDSLLFLARSDHPLVNLDRVTWQDLAHYPFVVAIEGTPTRIAFDKLFREAGVQPLSLIETGSMIVMRELLRVSDHICCLSRLQSESDARLGTIAPLAIDLPMTARPIGLTIRKDWSPTVAQQEFVEHLKRVAGLLDCQPHLPNLTHDDGEPIPKIVSHCMV